MILDSGYIIDKRPVNDIDASIKIVSQRGVFSYFIPRGNHFSSYFLGLFQPFYRVKFLYDIKGTGGLRIIYDYKDYEKLSDNIIFDEKKREFLFRKEPFSLLLFMQAMSVFSRGQLLRSYQ